MLNQVELLRGLQDKAERLGVTKGDLVELGCLAIVRSSDEKVQDAIGRLRYVPITEVQR